MGRANLSYRHVNCTGGINQQAEKARADECIDARNVWAPEGKMVTRPGYVGITSTIFGTATQTVLLARAEDVSAGTFRSPSGAGALSLLDSAGTASLVGRIASGGDQDRIYIGHSVTFNALFIAVTAANTAAVRYEAEYWNGSAWKHLNVNRAIPSGFELFSSGTGFFLPVAPQDWALTIVDSQSAYWIRLNLLDADFTNPTTIDVDSANTNLIGDTNLRGLFAPQFSTHKRYLFLGNVPGTGVVYANTSALLFAKTATTTITGAIAAEPASMAVVPQFDEAFIAYGRRITRHQPNDASSDLLEALVEFRDFAIGPGANYDKTLVPQETVFPRAKYIMFFQGRLWFADDYTVRWGAPAPFHKVIPSDSIEELSESDNSKITGLSNLGEYPVIFKNDSIWMAYDAGINAFGLREYDFRQVVAGIGCVSNSSIKQIRGNLIFLAEDGLYAFNGATAKKVSMQDGEDRLADVWPSITAGRRPFAAAAHWRTKSVYLLSVTTDGSDTHNLTIAWDYDADAFWLWDGIDAQHWLEDEASSDDETLYFGDSQGRIYQMGVGLTDHGGEIESYFTSHRVGINEGMKKRIRVTNIIGTNKTREVDVTLIIDDIEQAAQAVSFLDHNEKDWGTFTWGDSYTPSRRRKKRIDMRKDPDWVQVKISHSQKNQRMEISRIELGLMPLGRR